MFRSLITECRSVLEADEGGDAAKPQTVNTAEVAPKPQRRNKHDRAAHKIGELLGTPPQNLSRKKMLKMVRHMKHHFEKGHGAGEGDYKTVDSNDLATLSRHATNISAHADSMRRMPGPAHHMASHLCNHVANAHDRMSKWSKSQGNEEEAELHGKECESHRQRAAEHRKKARRHGFYDGEY